LVYIYDGSGIDYLDILWSQFYSLGPIGGSGSVKRSVVVNSLEIYEQLEGKTA